MAETIVWTGFVAAIVSLIVSRIVASGTPRGRTVLIEDPDGHARVELLAEPKGAWPEGVVGLRLLTKEGKHRAGLGTFEDGGTLAFLEETGLPRLSVMMEDGYPRIIFWQRTEPPGDEATRRIVLGLKPDGSHSLEFMHKDGACRASLGVQQDGTPFLALYDAKGDVIWSAPRTTG